MAAPTDAQPNASQINEHMRAAHRALRNNPLVRTRAHSWTHFDNCDWERLHASPRGRVNGTTAAHALAAHTLSHLIRLAGHLKASDRPLAAADAAPGDGDIPVAGLVCTLWANGRRLESSFIGSSKSGCHKKAKTPGCPQLLPGTPDASWTLDPLFWGLSLRKKKIGTWIASLKKTGGLKMTAVGAA